MELRQLEAFAAVMSTGSVTAAGRLLGRSQPAVSRLVQELESEIGYELFQRNGPRVSPTEQGLLLYEDVEHALRSLQQIRRRAKEIEQGLKRPLHLLATPALAAGLIPAALARLECSGTSIASNIQLRSASAERVAHGVLSGAAHLGVTSLPLEHRGLQVHWIAQAPCVAVLRKDDPLATLDVVPLAALAGHSVITMANPYRLRRRLDDAFTTAQGEAAFLSAPRFIETNSSINAMAAVRAGLGVAVLEPVSAYGLPLEGLAVRPLDTDIPFLFGVVSQQSTHTSAATETVCAALAQAAAHLLPGFVLHDASEHAALLQQTLPAGPMHAGGEQEEKKHE